MKKALWILAAALAVAGTFAVHWYLEQRRAESARAAKIERLAEFGITSNGHEDFLPLPPTFPHDDAAAALGGDLFRDRRLTAPAGRTCLSCHKLEMGGVDGKTHGGVLTRTVLNSSLAERFLRDGSVSGMPALVRRMIGDPKFGGGTNLAYSTAWIGSDIKFAYKFKKRFPEGVNPETATTALCEYLRTLVSFNGAFDRFCAGATNAFTAAETRGAAVFRQQGCIGCHNGPALGAWQVVDGRKVPALRGLGKRRIFMADGSRNDLSAVLPFMPGGEIDSLEDRMSLVAFLRQL